MIYVDIVKKFPSFELKAKFEFENGIMGLLGASGSGKSLTLKCIAGIEKPDSGVIILDDRVLFDSSKNINLSPQERKVGYLFQDYALFPNMTVFENVMVGVREHSEDTEEIVLNKLKEMHILHIKDKNVKEISGGEKQRVALARILVNKPNIILLDEPFSALDDFLKWKIELEVGEILKKYSINSILVSHSREEVYRLCDKISVITKGESEIIVDKKELFKNPKTLSACLLSGCKNYSRFKKISDNKIFALEWGIELETNKIITNDNNTVAIRSHYVEFVYESSENTFEIEIKKVIEDVFSFIVMISFKKNIESDFRIDVDKNTWNNIDLDRKIFVKLSKENLIILKDRELKWS